MTNKLRSAPAAREIDLSELDSVVGAGVIVPDARKQEQSEKAQEQDLKSA